MAMTTAVRVLTHLTMFAAAGAAVTAYRATRSGLPAVRALAAATGVLAGVYVIAYAVLLFFIESESARLHWTDTMRGVSLVSWLIVWVGWPAASIRLHRMARRRLDELAPPDDRPR